MNIRIEMGQHKANSRIFIDECEITRGVLDFDVDVDKSFPSVTLTVFPDFLTVSGEMGAVVKKDLLSRSHRWRRSAGGNGRFIIRHAFRRIRRFSAWVRDTWRQQHAANHDRKIWR